MDKPKPSLSPHSAPGESGFIRESTDPQADGSSLGENAHLRGNWHREWRWLSWTRSPVPDPATPVSASQYPERKRKSADLSQLPSSGDFAGELSPLCAGDVSLHEADRDNLSSMPVANPPLVVSESASASRLPSSPLRGVTTRQYTETSFTGQTTAGNSSSPDERFMGGDNCSDKQTDVCLPRHTAYDPALTWLQRKQVDFWNALAFRDWRVKTLVHALSAMGAPVDFIVVNCSPDSTSHAAGSHQRPPAFRIENSLRSSSASPTQPVSYAGYSPVYHAIWICGNRLWSPFEWRRFLIHELVHAFDFARAKLSPDNCLHVACTEIRAYNLSGQCSWWATRKWDESQFQVIDPRFLSYRTAEKRDRKKVAGDTSTEQECGENSLVDGVASAATPVTDQTIRRTREWQDTKRNRCVIHNTLNSLRDHPQCRAPGVAETAIVDVFQRCLQDTWPFMVPPERDSKWRPSRIWRDGSSEQFKK
ncbi:peptidase m76 family protein [Cystoisospora suis]|uniref:Peptidase m76 family protein n=1 Tax=Cystoisospora suis TaxID=483139 RepID=A0A2C6L6C4_9APIC|nr:peptidase m76 family protein [Cystoisospora suis]